MKTILAGYTCIHSARARGSPVPRKLLHEWSKVLGRSKRPLNLSPLLRARCAPYTFNACAMRTNSTLSFHRGTVHISEGRSLATSSSGEAPKGVGDLGEQDEHDKQEDEDEGDVFNDPREAILDAALQHVPLHGFSSTAMAAGAKDCGFQSVAVGMFPRGEADLVHHVMAKALQEVKSLGETRGDPGAQPDESSVSGSDEWDDNPDSNVGKLRAGVKAALKAIEPYRTHWPKAMAIGASPQNAGATATAIALLADELAFLSGDRSTDLSWYGKRALIAGIYSSSELFMLTDQSEDLHETWGFLDRRLEDYETLCSTPESMGDVVTGAGTVATSLSSAVVSLGAPFLRQASKQVPGGETLAGVAPVVSVLVSQAMSLLASRVPYGKDSAESERDSGLDEASGGKAEETKTFEGAPEHDPWGRGGRQASRGGGLGGSGAASATNSEKLDHDLAEEHEELFGKGRVKGEENPQGR